jgi:hypothetical protein
MASNSRRAEKLLNVYFVIWVLQSSARRSRRRRYFHGLHGLQKF